jgi:uncharacterized membrane protein YkvA (DUF1232 family)
MGYELNEQQIQNELKKKSAEAEAIIRDKDKLERFFQRLEKKLKAIPLAGDKLANVPIMASLIKSYVQKEYTDIPIGSIIAVISTLLYFVSPFDLIPDTIPAVGYIDDALVIAACLKLVGTDLDEYAAWRIRNGKIIDL